MKIKFEKEDVMDILKKHVETLIPGSSVERITSAYDGYECDVETIPEKKEPAPGPGLGMGGTGGTQ